MSPDSASAVARLLERLRGELSLEVGRLRPSVQIPPRAVPLPSRLSTGALASSSVSAVSLLAGLPAPPDPDRIALAYRNDRLLRIDGQAARAWSPFSGFWRTGEGWIRTHGNYPHHAAGLRTALRLDADADATRTQSTLLGMSGTDAVARITGAGGLAVRVLPEDPQHDAMLRGTPLLDVRAPGTRARDRRPHRPRRGFPPLDGVRVLDLTRVIAGPVCTRTLALLGADVLRIDPPRLDELDGQHLDTGHGKRTARLDARSERMHELIGEADVVVLGYRPAALERLGLSPDLLAVRHPGLVIARLSAWGSADADRAGFDSLVQAESGIALIESVDGEQPGVLPAQALDHSAGYLLAAAVIALWERTSRDGVTRIAETSLRRVAAELLGMPRTAEAPPLPPIDPGPHTAVFRVGTQIVTTVRSALPGTAYRAPRPWGRDQPRW